MVCPHCNYKHGSEWEDGVSDVVSHQGEHGDFYSLLNEITMIRDADSYHATLEYAFVYGCPSCKKLFMVD